MTETKFLTGEEFYEELDELLVRQSEDAIVCGSFNPTLQGPNEPDTSIADTADWLAKMYEEVYDKAMKQEAPPIGLRPRKLVEQMRTAEICEAMIRYSNAGKDVPKEWLDELFDYHIEWSGK